MEIQRARLHVLFLSLHKLIHKIKADRNRQKHQSEVSCPDAVTFLINDRMHLCAKWKIREILEALCKNWMKWIINMCLAHHTEQIEEKEAGCAPTHRRIIPRCSHCSSITDTSSLYALPTFSFGCVGQATSKTSVKFNWTAKKNDKSIFWTSGLCYAC